MAGMIGLCTENGIISWPSSVNARISLYTNVADNAGISGARYASFKRIPF